MKGKAMIDANERLAIYLRDDFSCQWCRREILGESRLTVDSLERTPKDDVDPNGELFTVCGTCVKWRSGRSGREFAADIGRTFDWEPSEILDRIAQHVTSDMETHRQSAGAQLAKYGSIKNFFDKGLEKRRSLALWDSFGVMRYENRVYQRLQARLGSEEISRKVERPDDDDQRS